MRLIALLLSLALVPVAAASGSVDAGVVRVEFDNGHASNCMENATGLCLAESSGGGGSTTIDAIQEFRFVEVGVYDGELESLFGVELLPDGSVRIDAEDLVLPNPVFRILAENVGRVQGPGPLSDFAVAVTDEGYGFSFFGVWPHNFPPETGRYALYVEHNESKGLGYEQIRVFNMDQNASTDVLFIDFVENPCDATDHAPCYETAGEIASLQQNSTPEILFGVGVPKIEGEYQDEPSPPTVAWRAETGGPFHRSPAVPGSTMIHRDNILPIGEQRLPPLTPSTGGDPAPPGATNRDRVPPEATLQDGEVREDRPSVAFFVSAAAGFVIALIAAAFYSRIRGDDVLSANRARLLEKLQARGPLTLSELSRELGLDRKTIEHHVRILQRGSLVSVHSSKRLVHIMLPGQSAPIARNKAETSPACRRIVAALEAAGGTLARDRVRDMMPDMPQRTRNHAMRLLADDGIVEQLWRPDGPVLVIKCNQANGAGVAFVAAPTQTSAS